VAYTLQIVARPPVPVFSQEGNPKANFPRDCRALPPFAKSTEREKVGECSLVSPADKAYEERTQYQFSKRELSISFIRHDTELPHIDMSGRSYAAPKDLGPWSGLRDRATHSTRRLGALGRRIDKNTTAATMAIRCSANWKIQSSSPQLNKIVQELHSFRARKRRKTKPEPQRDA
jgi:hypothetical protein